MAPRTPDNACYSRSVPRNGDGVGSQSGKFKKGFRHGPKDRGTPKGLSVPLTPGDFRLFLARGNSTASMGPPATMVRSQGRASRQGMPIPITLNVTPVNDNGPSEAKARPRQKQRLWWGFRNKHSQIGKQETIPNPVKLPPPTAAPLSGKRNVSRRRGWGLAHSGPKVAKGKDTLNR